jgi:hypothetical protein
MEPQPSYLSHPQTFHPFPLLPPELRLQVWRASCRPRIVTLIWDPSHNHYHQTTTPQPPLLSTTHESRTEALRIYRVLLAGRSPVYFAPHLDTLYIPRSTAAGYSAPAREITSRHLPLARDLVRSLAIDHVDPPLRREWETYSKWCLVAAFPRLEEAYLVLGGLGQAEERAKRRGDDDAQQRLVVEFVPPRGPEERVRKEKEDFLESWMYDLTDERDASGAGHDWAGKEEVRRNPFLKMVLMARRGERWASLWRYREARVVDRREEGEWWTARRGVPKEVLEERHDGTKYRTKNGIWYYRVLKDGAA